MLWRGHRSACSLWTRRSHPPKPMRAFALVAPPSRKRPSGWEYGAATRRDSSLEPRDGVRLCQLAACQRSTVTVPGQRGAPVSGTSRRSSIVPTFSRLMKAAVRGARQRLRTQSPPGAAPGLRGRASVRELIDIQKPLQVEGALHEERALSRRSGGRRRRIRHAPRPSRRPGNLTSRRNSRLAVLSKERASACDLRILQERLRAISAYEANALLERKSIEGGFGHGDAVGFHVRFGKTHASMLFAWGLP